MVRILRHHRWRAIHTVLPLQCRLDHKNRKTPISKPAANAQRPNVQAETTRTRLRKSCGISWDRSVIAAAPLARLYGLGRCSLERFDQRRRREWLCEISETPGVQRSLANGGVVVPGHVDDRHKTPSSFETMPQLDA